MDQVREALIQVAADVDRSRLGTPQSIRLRGARIRRRERLLGVEVALAMAALVAVGFVFVRSVDHSASNPSVHPVPTVTSVPTPTSSADASVAVLPDGCGHGVACPQATGTFRLVLRSVSALKQRTLDLSVPAGWTVNEDSTNGLRVLDTERANGLAVLWPVRSVTGNGRAQDVAQSVARLPGAVAAPPVPVTVDGAQGWRVTFSRTPHGTGQCIDPRFGLYVGEGVDGGCRHLIDLVTTDPGDGPDHQPVGVSVTGPLELTLLDDPGEGSSHVMLAMWRWGKNLAADPDSAPLLASVRLGTYADPSCGSPRPACATSSGAYIVHGDPVFSATGVNDWNVQAKLKVRKGWSIQDDGLGGVQLSDNGNAGLFLLWPARPQDQTVAGAGNARTLADEVAHRANAHSTKPVEVHVAGKPAWRIDISPVKGAVPYRQATEPYLDTLCTVDPPPYSVALVCLPQYTGGATVTIQSAAIYVQRNEAKRMWFVQVDHDHVLVIVASASLFKGFVPPILPAVVDATKPMIDSLTFEVRH